MNLTADAIAAAYLELADGEQDWVRLAKLRPLVPASHEEVTETLLDMVATGAVHLVPCSNRKTLTEDDHDAAIVIGGEPKNLLCIEDDYFGA